VTDTARLLDLVSGMGHDGAFEIILATTFNFDSEFFVHTGVLPALAGELNLDRAGQSLRRRISADVVRDALGNPFVGVIQGCPSPGATPAWVDRHLWPTRRLGVQHAKCLLAASRSNLHALVTSANLTDGSWCSNIEMGVAWTAPRQPVTVAERQAAAAIAELARGLRLLAFAIKEMRFAEAAAELESRLPPPTSGDPHVVWSGKPFNGHPLDGLAPGEELIVTSPFWPADAPGSARVVAELRRLAPDVTLVGRAAPGTAVLELPDAMATSSRCAGVKMEVAAAPNDPNSPTDAVSRRLLHAKQFSLRTGQQWRSYVGSANATVQGLALAGKPNVELGVVAEIGPLLKGSAAESTRPPPAVVDPDDPASASAAPFADSYATAHLRSGGVLELTCEPTPARGAYLEVPTGGPVRLLRQRTRQKLDVEADIVSGLLRRPEVTVVSSSGTRLPVPVVVSDDLVRAEAGATDLDSLLDRLRRNPLGRPSDDPYDGTDEPNDADGPPPGLDMARRVVPRKPVHRARETIEVITASEAPLKAFLATDPPCRLIELRLAGAGGILDLARRLDSTAGTDVGLTLTAAAFATIEIELLFSRLATAPVVVTALAPLRKELALLIDALLHRMASGTTPKRLRRLRKGT